ncbi:MAG: hypothetical protein Q8Q05_01755 [bacterium]|nr:hypothetical protein [bacterium]
MPHETEPTYIPNVEKEEMSFVELADQLDAMQAEKNEGRGVMHIRDIISYLRRGDIESAKAVARSEGDKTESYPDIKSFLEEHGLAERFDIHRLHNKFPTME